MALTQMQLIQSLGEAMAWFERELNWGVPPTELRHLCGRIGELYAAVITNGQLATEVNQKGYDVVAGNGERISVKTTAMTGAAGHISFNASTLDHVDRVVVLRVDTEEMQVEILLDVPVSKVVKLLSQGKDGKRSLPLSRLRRKRRRTVGLKAVREQHHGSYLIREIENGSIEVEENGRKIAPVKPVLREIAQQLHIGLLNSNGNVLNTRQLGSQIIRSIESS